jgi:hypothetical protein
VYAVAGKKIFHESKNTHRIFRLLETVVFLYAAWYFFNVMNLQLMGFLQILAAVGLFMLFISERNIFSPSEVLVNEKGIYTPGNMASRFIPWTEIDNMLVKSDYVSINTLKNQFIQFEINTILSDEQIDAINAFCREKFAKNMKSTS